MQYGLNLEKMQQVFSSDSASHIGAIRTTFRRYLKLLVSQTILDVDLNFGGLRRPEGNYFMRLLR